MTDLYLFDDAFRHVGAKIFCGVDEAGRGPLAGPVFAAAVVLFPQPVIEGINDSKKLTEKRREELFRSITSAAQDYAVGSATVGEIEEINILNATFLAMKRAVDGLKTRPGLALVDGNTAGTIGLPVRCIVGGDAKSASIAAASILAKVSRDRVMTELAEKYPQYGFDVHKGYGTRMHRERILEFGPCEIHRRSFLRKLLWRLI